MTLAKALNAWIKTLLITLSLCQTGVVCALAHVESRSQGASQQAFSNQASEGMQNSSLDTLQSIEYLQREMQELRGKVEEQTYQMQQMQEQHKKLYMDLDKRLREGGATSAKASGAAIPADQNMSNVAKASGIEFNAPTNQFVTDEPVLGESTAVAVMSANSVNDEKAYQEAYRLVQIKDFDGAIRAFGTMLAQSPQGKYAPNAQYWLGEIYLTKGSLEKAAESFTAVCKQYPQHPKAADSLLKLGYMEYNKGQWKRCSELFTQVKTQFPGTTSAQLADSRLQRMQQEGRL